MIIRTRSAPPAATLPTLIVRRSSDGKVVPVPIGAPPAAPVLPGHSAPSQRLINEAALIIYSRWRRVGLERREAMEHAAQFASTVAMIQDSAGARALVAATVAYVSAVS